MAGQNRGQEGSIYHSESNRTRFYNRWETELLFVVLLGKDWRVCLCFCVCRSAACVCVWVNFSVNASLCSCGCARVRCLDLNQGPHKVVGFVPFFCFMSVCDWIVILPHDRHLQCVLKDD